MQNMSLQHFRKIPAPKRKEQFIGHYKKPDGTVDVYGPEDRHEWEVFTANIHNVIERDKPQVAQDAKPFDPDSVVSEEDEGEDDLLDFGDATDFKNAAVESIHPIKWSPFIEGIKSGQIKSLGGDEVCQVLREIVTKISPNS